MIVKQKLIDNDRLRDVEAGTLIVALRVEKADGYDAVVSDGYGLGGEPIFLKRTIDFEMEVSDDREVYVITHESWTKMTNSLFMKKE